jgi:hypothetical protein
LAGIQAHTHSHTQTHTQAHTHTHTHTNTHTHTHTEKNMQVDIARLERKSAARILDRLFVVGWKGGPCEREACIRSVRKPGRQELAITEDVVCFSFKLTLTRFVPQGAELPVHVGLDAGRGRPIHGNGEVVPLGLSAEESGKLLRKQRRWWTDTRTPADTCSGCWATR